MSVERFVTVQFCDDIRFEVGNKYSLMGCYSDSLLVDPMPSLMPKFCAFIKVYTPVDRPLRKLVLRIMREDAVLAEMPFALHALEVPQPVSDGIRWQVLSAGMAISPFKVDAPCVLRVEAEADDELLNGGQFRIDSSN